VDLYLDDRLLHGRILHGWAPVLRPRRLLLVARGVRGAQVEVLYAAAAAELGVELCCLEPGGAPPPASADGDFWLTDAPENVGWLVAAGLAPRRLVVIGLREAGGRDLAKDLTVGETALAVLRELAAAGLEIVQQRFPGETPRSLWALLPADTAGADG
jgi:mannose/fructose/N-acetylgalactosamine-specific phosphotransferase system component IIB